MIQVPSEQARATANSENSTLSRLLPYSHIYGKALKCNLSPLDQRITGTCTQDSAISKQTIVIDSVRLSLLLETTEWDGSVIFDQQMGKTSKICLLDQWCLAQLDHPVDPTTYRIIEINMVIADLTTTIVSNVTDPGVLKIMAEKRTTKLPGPQLSPTRG